MPEVLLSLENLHKHYPLRGWGQRQAVRAVDGVSLEVYQGETLALVGESGSGKSTLGRLMLHLEAPTSGRVVFDGQELGKLPAAELRALRRQMQMVFQDPFDSLNPRRTALATVAEPLNLFGLAGGKQALEQARSLLQQVGLNREHTERYPHQLSGGQQQRVGIARALASQPRFVVFDEPTSALDVSVQAQLLNLIVRLRQELQLSSVFISHDLGVVSHLADRVAVLYLGQVIEVGSREEVFTRPQHPYTVALMSEIPAAERRMAARPIVLEGEIPSAVHPPSGCRFHTRCPFATPSCRQQLQTLRSVAPGHQSACGRVAELGLYAELEKHPGVG